jgi:hypothetical protein
MEPNNNDEREKKPFNFKRAGSVLLGAGTGVGASEYMFRNTDRGKNLQKYKYLRPFIGGYSLLQGAHIGNKLYNTSQEKMAMYNSTINNAYGDNPNNLPYSQNPASVINSGMNATTKAIGTGLGAGVGYLSSMALSNKGSPLRYVAPLIGAYAGYKMSDTSSAPNAYTTGPQ